MVLQRQLAHVRRKVLKFVRPIPAPSRGSDNIFSCVCHLLTWVTKMADNCDSLNQPPLKRSTVRFGWRLAMCTQRYKGEALMQSWSATDLRWEFVGRGLDENISSVSQSQKPPEHPRDTTSLNTMALNAILALPRSRFPRRKDPTYAGCVL